MFGIDESIQKILHIINVIGKITFCLLLLSSFATFRNTEAHILIKRESKTVSESRITPEECEKKIKESEGKEAQCFEIDHDEKCDVHCNDLGEEKCGGTKGKAYNFQCKNPQKGDRKACCCAFKCETKKETKKRLEKLYAKMKEDNRGLCSPFTDSEDGFKKELMRICSNDDRIHIARKYCLEEKKGERYFCLKVGECKGKRTKTCLGCIAHECVMEGEDEGDHIVVPEEYEKERLQKKDFDKTGTGNVQDINNVIKKEKKCTTISCRDDDCDKICRASCKEYGNTECGEKALSYGTTVEGKRSGGKKGENKCCCEPVCSPKEGEHPNSGEKKEYIKSGQNSGANEAESDRPNREGTTHSTENHNSIEAESHDKNEKEFNHEESGNVEKDDESEENLTTKEDDSKREDPTETHENTFAGERKKDNSADDESNLLENGDKESKEKEPKVNSSERREVNSENLSSNRRKDKSKEPEDERKDISEEHSKVNGYRGDATPKDKKTGRTKSSHEQIDNGSKSAKEETQRSRDDHTEENKDYKNTDDFYKNYGIDDEDDDRTYSVNSKSESKYDY